jgi:hypothetical protein
VSGSATAPRRTLSGLDTDRCNLGFLSPTIREWQSEIKLCACCQSLPAGAEEAVEFTGPQ